jgi:NDP-sugar pyrophosphorylase family protein
MSGKRAVILAGGKGKRLAPYTFVIPKPIVPIGTTPILEIVLRQLAHHGFTRIDIALGHLSEIIRAVAGDGSKFGIQIEYTDEPIPLGTMGPLKRISGLSGNFVVMNADLLTDLDYDALWRFHEGHAGPATVATYGKTTQLGLGVIQTDGTGRVVAFEEKPTLRHTVSMGIYVFHEAVLQFIPDGKFFGFDDLMRTLLEVGEPVATFGFAGRWLDIGIPEDYERAQEEFEQNQAAYLPEPRS